MRSKTRGVILPVVMFILILLGLLGAVFAFRVNADLSSTQAVGSRMQTRLAAEAGVEWAKLMLRAGRFDQSLWYRNMDAFNRIVVWAHDTDASVAGTNDEFKDTMSFRFSIVADNPADDEDYIRFGLTDESSKLNLNVATTGQLLTLVSAVVGEDEEVDAKELVDAILDWRDGDSEPRTEAGDTEGVYYSALDKPYAVKNSRFDTVEELLLVKGVTAGLLYGEDFDRNGLLTDNEDDGDLSFPPDNEDGLLNRGIYPHLTVHSYENNVSNGNRQRLYLFGEESVVQAELDLLFPDEPEVVDFCVSVTRTKPGGSGGSGGPGGGGSGSPGGDPAAGPGDAGAELQPTGGAPGGSGRRGGPAGSKPPGGSTEKANSTDISNAQAGKIATSMQVRDPNPGDNTGTPGAGLDGGENPLGEGGAPPDDVDASAAEGDGQPGDGGAQGGYENPEGGGGTGDGGSGSAPIRSPASLLLPQKIGDAVVESPLAPRHLAVLMDRTTTVSSDEGTLEGLININTAPRIVLECLDALSDEQIDAILEARGGLDSETQSTTAWLVTEGILDPETFELVAPVVTARGQQFTIDSLGYADHIGMVTRLQVIVDMIGPIAQTVYYRDVSYLGGHFPIREEDVEKQRGR